MWELILVKSEVFQFPKRNAQVNYWGSVISTKENLNSMIEKMKAAKSFTDKQATKDFFLGITDEEDFVMSNYSYLWAMDKYDLDDLAENLKLLKEAVMPLIKANISEEQSKRSKQKTSEQARGRYSWKKKSWKENVNNLINDIESGSNADENIKALNAFIEDESDYVKSNPISEEGKNKLLLGLKRHKAILTTRASIVFIVKNKSDYDEIKQTISEIFGDWETKTSDKEIIVMKTYTTDNADVEVKQLMLDLSHNLQEAGIPKMSLTVDEFSPKLTKSALAQHLGYKSQEQIGKLELEPEKNYKVAEIDTRKVKTYIHQFLNTTFISKYVSELLPEGDKGYTGSLLGEIFVKRKAGNRPRLNKYLDVLLEDSVDKAKADDYFESFRKALATRMFVNEDKIRTDFVRDAVNIFLLENNRRDFVTPFSTKGKRDKETGEGEQRMTPEQIAQYTERVKNRIKDKVNYKLFSTIDGVSDTTKVKDIQNRIVELISEGGEWTEAYNEYEALTQEKVNKTLHSMTKPIMTYLFELLETDNLRRVARRHGMDEKELIHIRENPQLKSEEGITEDLGKEKVTLYHFEDTLSSRYAVKFVTMIRENSRAARAYEQWKRSNPQFKSMLVQEGAIKFLYDARGYQSPNFENQNVLDKFNTLSSLEKGVAAIIYETFKSKKSIRKLFEGKVRHSAKQMDFLELIHVIANADGELGETGRFERVWSKIESAFEKNSDMDIAQAEEIPFMAEIRLFSNKIKAALKSIKNGLQKVIENKLKDIIANQEKYKEKFDREIVTNEKRGTKTYFKIMDRLHELGLIVEA